MVKVWRAMQRVLRALGEQSSVRESGVIEGRSSDQSPLAIRVLAASEGVFSTSPVPEGLLKVLLPLTAVVKLASAVKC